MAAQVSPGDDNNSSAARGKAEISSGKGARDENFPVASLLLPRRLRPHVSAFYALARATDDIADSPLLDSGERRRRLERFEQALKGEASDGTELEKAKVYRRSAQDSCVSVQHAIDLIHAFKQDTCKTRYRNWEELMGYCELSAAPVGRFLLDLHREEARNYRFSDPLCHALQVLNHLQDIRGDYLDLDRIYLPGDWMNRFGVEPRDLGRDSSSPGLRGVIDLCLDGCRDLLNSAQPLVGALRNPRLAAQADVTAKLAGRLLKRLEAGDPLARRVALSRQDFLICGFRSLPRMLWHQFR